MGLNGSDKLAVIQQNNKVRQSLMVATKIKNVHIIYVN